MSEGEGEGEGIVLIIFRSSDSRTTIKGVHLLPGFTMNAGRRSTPLVRRTHVPTTYDIRTIMNEVGNLWATSGQPLGNLWATSGATLCAPYLMNVKRLIDIRTMFHILGNHWASHRTTIGPSRGQES